MSRQPKISVRRASARGWGRGVFSVLTIGAVAGLATLAMWSPGGTTLPLLSVGVSTTTDDGTPNEAGLWSGSSPLDRVTGAVSMLRDTAAHLPTYSTADEPINQDEPVESASTSTATQSRAKTAAHDQSDDQNIRWFNGRPVRAVKTITMVVTAYSPDAQSCGIHADGITASGYSVWTNGMKLVAADTNVLPFGSLITIPGYDNGDVVPVLDRGGAIKGNRLDVLYPTHERALQWGVQEMEVTVWEYADGKPDDFRTQHHRR